MRSSHHSHHPSSKRSIHYSSTGMPDPNPYSSNGPSKRSKPPAQPFTVPPGQVAFRLLCRASRIGGVIGKSGFIIKQLQHSTGAKIRVEEAPSDCPDRVITVSASPELTSRLQFVDGGEFKESCSYGVDGGDCDESVVVSKAQDALVRVFGRILEVAAEEGVAVAGGMISCRLLAEVNQVGSVIGKGGKVVEKIRKDCGCKIRVLTDKMPSCANPSEEMIDIEGDVLAVKKGIVAVSRCLQDCPPVDKMKITGSRPLDAAKVPNGTLPDVHIDMLSQRNTVLSTRPSSSYSYTPSVRPLSTEPDIVSALDTRTLQLEVTFQILCLNEKVGGVIGKGGTIIQALQNETGASVSIGASLAECDERLITITSSENSESRYSPAQRALALVFSRSLEAGIEKGLDSSLKSSVTARLLISSNQVGCLIGKGGTIISEIRKVTGTSIRILSGDLVPKCASENDQVVQISGEFSNVKDALYNVSGRLRDNSFSSAMNGAGTRSSHYIPPEMSPFERLHDASPELRPSVAPSHSYKHTSLTHSMDHLGISRSLDHLGISRGLDHPSSARLWEPQTVGGFNPRDTSDISSGLTSFKGGLQTVGGFNPRDTSDIGSGLTSFKGGLELGSGRKSAFVTNTTVEIVVPDNVIGSVYGESGNNLTRLRQISGAKVTVHEPQPGSSESILVISGTPDETQVAQSLLQAFILTG